MTPPTIRTLPINSLEPAGYNPRTVTAKARRKLKASLECFGLVEPLVWNRRSGHLVGGHMRLQILKELGVTEVLVSVVDLDEPAEKALNVMLNNLEAQGRYDTTKLREVLRSLDASELPSTGFEALHLRSMELVPEQSAVPPDEEATVLEVTLIASREAYEALVPRLDGLIREFDLISHVRERQASATAPE